ncbi:MAG TPA: glycosyltransferase family 2 protein, partial [Ilumatobacteraceae bacterium]
EAVGFASSVLLIWALWRRLPPVLEARRAAVDSHRVDVVIRVDDQPVHQVRASVLAAQTMVGGRTVIVDLGARVEIAAMAAEFGTVYAAPDVDDHNGLKTCSAASSTPIFFVLDAGDIPTVDAIATLRPYMDDDRVAVAIGQSTMTDDDSAEHGPNGIHELRFDRERLNPALGTRGAAIFTESGALIRRAAVDSVMVDDDTPIEAQARWSLALMEQGWRIVAATGGPVLVRQVIDSQEVVYERRVARARVARQMVFGSGGALRWGSLRLGQRLAVASSAIQPLSGLRRAGFLAAIVGSLLTGMLPLRPDVTILAALWLPGWLMTSLGLVLLSDWTLRPGDRTRWSMRNLGASWQGLRHPIAFEQRRAPVMTPHALQHGGALVASVVVLSSVMMMRGLSEQWTHALGAMPYRWLAGLVAVGLWSLAMALDVLRMMGRRTQLRRATRVVASVPAVADDHPVVVFDLTPLGVGFETSVETVVKQELALEATVTTELGCENVALPIVVRHVHQLAEQRWRVGAEFGKAAPQAFTPLVEFCMVEPARRRTGQADQPGVLAPVPFEVVVAPMVHGRRMALRLFALLAVLGAIASAQPGDGTPLAWLVSAGSILLATGVLIGSARPRRRWTDDQSTSSPSPDLAIR